MPETSIKPRVPIHLYDQFTLICNQNNMTAFQVIRKAMRSYKKRIFQ